MQNFITSAPTAQPPVPFHNSIIVGIPLRLSRDSLQLLNCLQEYSTLKSAWKSKTAMLVAIARIVLEMLVPLIAREGQFLAGVGDDVEWLRDELRSMRSLLQDADEDVGTSSIWINQIREIVYDAQDIIDTFDFRRNRRIRSCITSFPSNLKSRHHVGREIKQMRTRIDDISRRRLAHKPEIPRPRAKSNDSSLYGLLASSPLVHDGDLVGVEEDLELLLGMVLGGGHELGVISVVGMGGAGKTTVVKKVYNHARVKRDFDRSAWIHVSRSSHLREIFLEMAKGLMEVPSSDLHALDEKQVQEMLLVGLEDKRYLVVLDDVWDQRLWETVRLVLPRNGPGSRVVLTTRNHQVASSIIDAECHVHQLRSLSEDESWALFCNKVFSTEHPSCCPEELRELGKEIVRKCDGLPLAVVAVGGMMSRKERIPSEWRRVLDAMYGNFWNEDVRVHNALLMSYKDLTCTLKSCFLYCSLFPRDSEISRKRLIRLWVGEGFIDDGEEAMEDVAEKFLTELINRSMIQVSKMSVMGRIKACRVHDLLHQITISISRRENFSTVVKDQTTTMEKKVRRVSYQKNCYNGMPKDVKLQLRSMLMFGVKEPLRLANNVLRKNYMLLRVLDLEDACLLKLPKGIGALVHLRYLGLKGTKLQVLPTSLQNLKYLQTLDIRRTRLRELSFPIERLTQLRHLEMKQVGSNVTVPFGLANLERLQAVTGLQANCIIVQDLKKLTQLKKLGVGHVRAEDMIELCASISKMCSLSSLSIFSKGDAKPLDFEQLSPSSSLQKLHVAGCLEKLPHWLGSVANLTKLRLGLSQLKEDPFPVLKELPSLIFLQVYEAYPGRLVKCNKPGFNKLKILVLTGLEELEEWVVEEGTMPCIQELWIMSCSMLHKVPLGFQFLTTLQKLRLVGMPESFIKRLSPSRGEDFNLVRHVPSIQILE